MSRNVLLMFAYHFPPDPVIGAARPARLAKYLERLGYTCHVITAAGQDGAAAANVDSVPDPFIGATSHGPRWQFERAVRRIFLPGELGTQWAFDARKAARSFLRAHPADRVTVFSTFPPIGVHQAGWLLARSETLPWIADFRDPMADSPAFHKVVTPFQRDVYRKLERVVFRSASGVIANTGTAADFYRSKYPEHAHKVHTLWNGFDPEFRVEPLPLESTPFKRLLHAGELYNGRSVIPLLLSVARLLERGRLDPARIRLSLVGPADADTLPPPEFLSQAQSQGWLELRPPVPPAEARRMTQTCHGLLLVQPHSAIQVPGKLFDYIQIGRPILAFLAPNSPIEMILQKSGVPHQCIFTGDSPESIDSALMKHFALPSDPVAPSSWFEDQFSAPRQAETMASIIEALPR